MMPGKKVITDSMDSKEIIALLHEDFAFGQHKYDETFISFEMTGFGERHFIDFTAEEGLKRGFEFKLPYENFNDFREEYSNKRLSLCIPTCRALQKTILC